MYFLEETDKSDLEMLTLWTFLGSTFCCSWNCAGNLSHLCCAWQLRRTDLSVMSGTFVSSAGMRTSVWGKQEKRSKFFFSWKTGIRARYLLVWIRDCNCRPRSVVPNNYQWDVLFFSWAVFSRIHAVVESMEFWNGGGCSYFKNCHISFVDEKPKRRRLHV